MTEEKTGEETEIIEKPKPGEGTLKAEAWNQANPVGTDVICTYGGATYRCQTTSPAAGLMGDAVLNVSQFNFIVPLDSVKVAGKRGRPKTVVDE